jgi:hypothetical protein
MFLLCSAPGKVVGHFRYSYEVRATVSGLFFTAKRLQITARGRAAHPGAGGSLKAVYREAVAAPSSATRCNRFAVDRTGIRFVPGGALRDPRL